MGPEERFISWLSEKGLEQHPFSSKEFQRTGRGAAATRDIKSGELIAYIPLELLITTQTVYDAYGHALTKLQRPLSASQWLSAFLILEKRNGSASDYHAYIEVLPTSYDLPLSFSPDEVAALPRCIQGMGCCLLLRMRVLHNVSSAFIRPAVHKEASQHGKRHPTAFGPPPSREEFIWAWCTVNTRCVYMDVKSALGFAAEVRGKDDCALAPFLDLLNHTCNAKVTSGYNKKTRRYEIRTHDIYRAGEQVFISYGPHDNAALLLEYGFVLPDNAYDTVSFDKEAEIVMDELKNEAASSVRHHQTPPEHLQASTGLNPILAKIAQQRAEAKNQGREANAAQAVLLEARLRLIDDLGLSGLSYTQKATNHSEPTTRSGLLCGLDGISWQLMSWALALSIEQNQWAHAADWVVDHDKADSSSRRKAFLLLQKMAVRLLAEENVQMVERSGASSGRYRGVLSTLWDTRKRIISAVLDECRANLDETQDTL